MTTPTQESVKALADGLTKAQRKAIKQATMHDESREWRAFAMFPADKNLRSKGLTCGLWGALTPLGLAVRAHLGASHD